MAMLDSLTLHSKTMFISPRNPTILNLGLLQQAHVHALLYADVMRPVAKSLQKFDPSMAFKQVPPMAELLKLQSSPYRFDASYSEIKDEKCLILHSSGSTGIVMTRTPSSQDPTNLNGQDRPSWCISLMPHFHAPIMIRTYLFQKGVVHRMRLSSTSIHRGGSIHAFRRTM